MTKSPAQARNRIKEWRLRRARTLHSLAHQTGCSVTKLSRLENGERKLRVDDARRIADSLGCTLDDLTGPEPRDAKEAIGSKRNVRRGNHRPQDVMLPNIGPFRDEAAAQRTLVDRLALSLSPEAIILFGSRANRRARPDSDFDFIVVSADEIGDAGRDYDRVYAPVMGLGVACDVVPCLVSDFVEGLRQPGTLAHACLTAGKVLYRRPGVRLDWLPIKT